MSTNKTALQGNGYDYSSPFFRATIIHPSGLRIPLWTDLGLSEQERQSLGLYTIKSLPYVQELSIELQPAYLPIMKVKMVFPYKEGIEFLGSKVVEWAYSELEIVFGYTGGTTNGPILSGVSDPLVLSPTFKGTLLMPTVDIGTEVIVTLNAQGVGGFAANNTKRPGGPFVGKRRDLIEFFASGEGLNANIKRNLKVNFDKVDSDNTFIPEWNLLAETVEVAPNNKTDWNLIFELAQEANCWMSLIGNVIHIYPKAIMAQKVSRVFRHFDFPMGNISPSTATFPVLRFSTEQPAIYLPSDIILSNMKDISDGDPKKLIQSQLDQAKAKVPTSGKGNVGVAPTSTTPAGANTFVGSPEVPKWIAQREADLRSAMQYIGMQIKIDTLGVPDLLPLETIALRGFGTRIDADNFTIFKVFHTFGTNGFLTSFEAFKNVQGEIAKSLSEQIPQAKGISSPKDLPQFTNGKVTVVDAKALQKRKTNDDTNNLINDIKKSNKKVLEDVDNIQFKIQEALKKK